MKKVRLSEITNLLSGSPFDASLFNDEKIGLPLIRVRDVNSGFAGFYYSGKFDEQYLIKNGDILISLDGDFKSIEWKNGEGLLNQRVCKIIPKSHLLNKDFLLHFLPETLKGIHRNTSFTTVKHLSTKTINNIEIPLPSLPDQLHIANLLSKAETLITQRKETLRLLDEYLKSTFLEMFGDPGINSKNWPIKKLEEHIEYMGDIGSNGSNEMVSKNLEMLDTEDYAIMIRTTNLTRNDFTNNIKYVTQKTYEFFKKSKIHGGEIIMNKIGSAGDFWLMPYLNRPVTLGLNQLVIRTKKLPTLFLFHFLSTDYGRMIVKAQAKGATTKSITKTAVKALSIIYPPIELQNKFVTIVEKTEALKIQYQQSLQELENLYSGLSQKAFRGELGN
ncbi:MAG: restriction endonuclease subunit S [Bacteroidia bacterium]|nr:restriction endonuclease subunit S [Bacteroidia bacterium]